MSIGNLEFLNKPVSSSLLQKFEGTHKLSEELWKRFVKEILSRMNRRTRWFECVENLQVGDIIIKHSWLLLTAWSDHTTNQWERQ